MPRNRTAARRNKKMPAGIITENHLNIMGPQWLSIENSLAADIDRSGRVDIIDLSHLAANWLK